MTHHFASLPQNCLWIIYARQYLLINNLEKIDERKNFESMNLRRSSFHLKWCLLPSRPNVWSATTSWPTTATTSTSRSVERSVAEARVHDCDAAGDAATTKSVWASHRLVRSKRKSGWRKMPGRSKRFAFSETFYSSSNASRVTICQRRHVWRSVKCVTCVTICGWEMSLLSPNGIEAFFGG